MKEPLAALLVVLPLAFAEATASSGGGMSLPKSVLDQGGGVLRGGASSVSFSLGQPAVGAAAGSSARMNWGFYGTNGTSGGVVLALPPQQTVSALQTYAYPVPFRPSGPNAGNGAGKTGTEAGGITFASVPPRATVEVYNVRGELVWRGEEASGGTTVAWNVRDRSGDPAASGVYLFVVRHGKDRRIGKLAVVR